ncbi:hypothetical protein HDU93_006637 [Gonapodya sp. JEL0774]|nr:hypothetical protein HDU93_006637 [Gonapodya sp. JEL0774]
MSRWRQGMLHVEVASDGSAHAGSESAYSGIVPALQNPPLSSVDPLSQLAPRPVVSLVFFPNPEPWNGGQEEQLTLDLVQGTKVKKFSIQNSENGGDSNDVGSFITFEWLLTPVHLRGSSDPVTLQFQILGASNQESQQESEALGDVLFTLLSIQSPKEQLSPTLTIPELKTRTLPSLESTTTASTGLVPVIGSKSKVPPPLSKSQPFTSGLPSNQIKRTALGGEAVSDLEDSDNAKLPAPNAQPPPPLPPNHTKAPGPTSVPVIASAIESTGAWVGSVVLVTAGVAGAAIELAGHAAGKARIGMEDAVVKVKGKMDQRRMSKMRGKEIGVDLIDMDGDVIAVGAKG